MGNGPSALHQAVLSGEVARCRIAIQEHPAQIDDTEPSNGWTALHIASAKGYGVIVRELLARGAAPNLVDREGRTALHLAAAEGHAVVVKDLLRKGADPLWRNQAGKMPHELALERQHSAAAALLAEALAGRGVQTPTGSPTAWQAHGTLAQPDGGVRLGTPDLSTLALDGAGGAAAGAAGRPYPQVPQPLPTAPDAAWVAQLPVPPGASISAPSAPPAPPLGAGAAGAPALPDYYSYIRPMPSAPPDHPAPGGLPVAPDVAARGQRGGPLPAYPSLPSAATAPPAAGPGPGAYGSAPQPAWPQQLPPPWQQGAGREQPGGPWGAAQAPDLPAPPPPAPPPLAGGSMPATRTAAAAAAGAAGTAAAAGRGEEEDDEDDWGAAPDDDDDDWGAAAERSSARPRPAGSQAQQPPRQQGPPVDLNAAVGAAVKGASTAVGVVAGTAVAGARQLLTGLIPKGGRGSPGPDSPRSHGAFADMPGATTMGPAGRVYSYEDLAGATQGFNPANKLGAGGYGPVFRGVLDGLPVAVKLLDPSGVSSQGPKEFAAEVAILSRLHHPHIVLLIGSCPERCALVYEMLEGGSLEAALFNPAMPDLAWQDRVRIACEAASALLFLHSAPEPIVHMDLKPGNLLLNRALACKVGDVGLSRLMPAAARAGAHAHAGGGAGGGAGPVSTVLDSRLVGTPCYMDPEYLRTGRYGPKSDTYSLGVILLQMLTGLEAARVVSVVEAALARSQADAASFASVVDPRSGSWPITEAASFAHLAMRCVELSRANRPDLRTEVLPALLQLAERARLYDSRAVRRCTSIGGGGGSQPPSMFICPITQDVMEDPVFAADGYTYEREAIAGWVDAHRTRPTSPMTNLPLAHAGLTPNLGLRSAIKEWKEKHGA